MKKQSRKNKENMEKRRRKAWAKTLKKKAKKKAALKKSIVAADNKRKLQEEVQQKMNMFSRLPNNCNLCKRGFDRRDREQVSSWKVVVMGEEVTLYYPPCQAIVDSKIQERTEGEQTDGL